MNLSGFMRTRFFCLMVLPIAFLTVTVHAQESNAEVKANYTKSEQMIAMRDGVKLFTSIYAPKERQKVSGSAQRTPYSVALMSGSLQPLSVLAAVSECSLFCYQDVRGR